MFDHCAWNAEFLRNPGQNDAGGLSVRIQAIGGALYRCIGVHHLTGAENRGNHNIFLEVLDEAGQRLEGAVVEYTWNGRHEDEAAPPTVIDKPAGESGASIPMWPGQTISCWVHGPNDRVINLTCWPDQPDTPGNTRYHHSYYVVWQRGAAIPPLPPDDGGDEADVAALRARVAQLEAVIAAIVPILEAGRARLVEAMDVTIAGVRAEIDS